MVENWIERPELEQLVAALINGDSGVVALVPEIDGAAGFGTTALAAAACADRRVVDRFHKGIAWLTVGGDRPERLTGLLTERIMELDGEPDTETMPDRDEMLATVTAPGDGLLVLDGLTSPRLALAAAWSAPYATVLVTTRAAAIVPDHATLIRVPPPAEGWPALVTLAGAMNTTPPAHDVTDAASVTAAAHRLLAEGLPRLGLPQSVERLMELAVFAGEGTIPKGLAQRLWHESASLSEVDAELTLAGLSVFGLLSTAPDRPVIILPDLVRQFARGRLIGESLATANHHLLGVLGDGPDTASSPEDRDYLLGHLPGHLTSAGQDVADLVCSGWWISSKLAVYGLQEVEKDLALAGTGLAGRLRRALAQNTHLLTSLDQLDVLAARLHGFPAVAADIREQLRGRGTAWLECLWTPPDLSYPSLRRTLPMASGTARAVAISPDGWLVTADDSHTARIWNPDGTIRATLNGHPDVINTVAVAPDGGRLATGSIDGTVGLWSPDGTMTALLTGPDDGRVERVAIAPDGTWVAAATSTGIRTWSRDGTALWSAKVDLRDLPTLAIGPDSSWVAVTDNAGGVSVWNRDGLPHGRIDDPGNEANSIAAHPSQDLLVVQHDDDLRLWSPEGRLLHTVPDTEELWEYTGPMAVTPDGSALVGSRFLGGGLQVVSLPGGQVSYRSAHLGEVRDVAVSGDGAWLATAGADGTVKLWDLAEGLPLPDEHMRSRSMHKVRAARSGDWLVTGEDGLSLWDGDGRALDTHHDDELFYGLAISPDETWLAATDFDGRLWLMNRDGTMRTIVQAHQRATDVVAISPTGDWLATCGDEEGVKLWRPDGAPLGVLTTDPVRSLAIGPGGQWVAAAGNDQVSLWDVGDRRRRWTWPLDNVTAVTVSPTGDWLAATTSNGDVQLLDVDGDPTGLLVGPLEHLTGLDIGPFGWWLATVSLEGEVRVWDVAEQIVLTAMKLDSPLRDCVWAPGGSRLYVTGDRGFHGFKLHQR